jgi:putative RNA 2'-phosphotransferase
MSSESKFLSKVLRHNPEIIGLTIDDEGWADVQELMEKMNVGRFPKFTDKDLDALVEFSDKKRFEFNIDMTKIRACQGHSIPVNLGVMPIEPPMFLFHGTQEETWRQHIRHEGLKPMNRILVHLSEDRATAIQVATRRKGTPIILEILSHAMWENGHVFFQASNGVWLTKSVPREYVYVPLQKIKN